jgi:hypothetical protein
MVSPKTITCAVPSLSWENHEYDEFCYMNKYKRAPIRCFFQPCAGDEFVASWRRLLDILVPPEATHTGTGAGTVVAMAAEVRSRVLHGVTGAKLTVHSPGSHSVGYRCKIYCTLHRESFSRL